MLLRTPTYFSLPCNEPRGNSLSHQLVFEHQKHSLWGNAYGNGKFYLQIAEAGLKQALHLPRAAGVGAGWSPERCSSPRGP